VTKVLVSLSAATVYIRMNSTDTHRFRFRKG
jgi:hypothetical protein